uniref:Uncharacterized protein n=1 Tax=Oryzias latipes TaxID=8090 RepID=A0A3P9JAH5_ORYLA
MEQIMMGIYDMGINVEGVAVLHELKDAHAPPFGLVHDLNLSYPPDFKYTFEYMMLKNQLLDKYSCQYTPLLLSARPSKV